MTKATTTSNQFSSVGFWVERGVYKPGYMKAAREAWNEFAYHNPRVINKWNPVDWPVDRLSLPDIITEMLPALREPVGEIAQWSRVEEYNLRFVVKDPGAHATPLHQDTGYHRGFPKLSAFIAFTPSGAGNGGITVYSGTHKYGYLGDVGEIDRRHLAPAHNEILFPGEMATTLSSYWASEQARLQSEGQTLEMQPGDVLFMDSYLWHDSGPNLSSDARVLADVIFQNADCKRWPAALQKNPFVRSRTSRLIELQAEVDRLKDIRGI